MKKFFLAGLLITVHFCVNAQYWETDGNTSSNPVTDFVGTTDNTDLRFRTNNAFRMGFNGTTGFLGLNTTTPQMRFHVLDGGILSTGTTGTNPDLGAGTRLMWIPDRAAFRVGRVGNITGANWWDSPNVGLGSVAMGYDNLASGAFSFAFGESNEATGIRAFALGSVNLISGATSTSLGHSNVVSGISSTAIGFRSLITSDNSYTLGRNLFSSAHSNVVIGRGIDDTTPLENDVPFSMMVGFDSNVSTLFVGASDGTANSFGNVGIGNITAPTEVLDVNGTARFRVMPESSTPDVLITGVEVDAEGDYVLNHLDFNGSATQFLNGQGNWVNGTNVCDWTITGQNLTAGHPTACHTGNVGIGRATPARKLDVLNGTEPTIIGGNSEVPTGRFVNNNTFSRTAGVMGVASQETPSTAVGANTGGYFVGANAGSATGSNYGVVAVANDLLPQGGEWVPSARESMAVRAYASSGKDVFGVYATATQGSWRNFGVSGFCYRPISGSYSIGVAGRSDCDQNHVPLMNIGVYGEVRNGCGLPQSQNYAGYFAGNVMIGGNIINFSDASLKTDVQEIEGALNTINQLMPKTYNYLTEENQSIGLPSGQQYGLIAQEVAEVLPNLTQLVGTLPDVDSLGNVLTESNEFLAINYTGLIPVLISGMKEQQSIIESQNEVLAQMMNQLANMQQQINQCCNADDGTKSMPGGAIQPQDFNNQKSIEGGNELYQNIPNPFRESTTISYQLEEGGRVQLSIYDHTGKVVTTLTDANQGPGRYSEVWNANGMPSGVYHYALYVNGELLVKRAIKLQE